MKVSVCLLSLLLFTVSTLAQPWIIPGTRTNKLIGPVWIQGYGLTVDAGITAVGNISGAYFIGDGSLLTGVSVGGTFNQKLTNAQSFGVLSFPTVTGSSNYIFGSGDSLIFSNAQNGKIFGKYADTEDAWFFYSPMNVSQTVTAAGFASSATAGTPGIITLTGTNGNKRIFNGGQSNLTYSGGSGVANSNINIDASSSDIFFLLVTNYTFISFTNLTCGQYGNVHLVMGNGGGWPVAFNTNWVRTNDVDSYTLKTNVGSYNVLGYLNGPYCTNTEVGIRRGF